MRKEAHHKNTSTTIAHGNIICKAFLTFLDVNTDRDHLKSRVSATLSALRLSPASRFHFIMCFFTAFLPHSHISFCFYLKVVPWCKCASAFNWWATNEPHSLYSLEKTSTKTCTHTHAGTRTHTHTQRHTSSRVWFFFYWTRTSKIILSRLSNSFVTLEIYSNVLTHFYTCWSKTRQLPSKSPALWVLPINLSQIGPLR